MKITYIVGSRDLFAEVLADDWDFLLLISPLSYAYIRPSSGLTHHHDIVPYSWNVREEKEGKNTGRNTESRKCESSTSY